MKIYCFVQLGQCGFIHYWVWWQSNVWVGDLGWNEIHCGTT